MVYRRSNLARSSCRVVKGFQPPANLVLLHVKLFVAWPLPIDVEVFAERNLSATISSLSRRFILELAFSLDFDILPLPSRDSTL